MGAASSNPESNAKSHDWTPQQRPIERRRGGFIMFPHDVALFLSCRVCGLLKFENPLANITEGSEKQNYFKLLGF
jgi:hypothetical protein